jgi:glutaconyl-CoA decarboxylase
MKYVVTLRDKTYEVEVEHGEAMLIDEYEAKAPVPPAAAAPAVVAAAPAAAAAAPAPVVAGDGTPVVAPMPGNVLKVLVKPGEAVAEGQTLVILEAMKMENEICAPKSGTVAQVLTSKGSTVNTGDAMISIS